MDSVFYIYCDGYDLHEIADQLTDRIIRFAEPYGHRVLVVNRREGGDGPDLPPWDIGINFEERSLTESETRDLFLFFHLLASEFDREFVVGLVTHHGLADDLVTISASTPIERTIDLVLNQNKKANQSIQTRTTSGPV